MAQKNATPTKAQAEVMKRNGISTPFVWAVVKDLNHSIIIRNRLDGEFRVIEKGGCWNG